MTHPIRPDQSISPLQIEQRMLHGMMMAEELKAPNVAQWAYIQRMNHETGRAASELYNELRIAERLSSRLPSILAYGLSWSVLSVLSEHRHPDWLLDLAFECYERESERRKQSIRQTRTWIEDLLLSHFTATAQSVEIEGMESETDAALVSKEEMTAVTVAKTTHTGLTHTVLDEVALPYRPQAKPILHPAFRLKLTKMPDGARVIHRGDQRLMEEDLAAMKQYVVSISSTGILFVCNGFIAGTDYRTPRKGPRGTSLAREQQLRLRRRVLEKQNEDRITAENKAREVANMRPRRCVEHYWVYAPCRMDIVSYLQSQHWQVDWANNNPRYLKRIAVEKSERRAGHRVVVEERPQDLIAAGIKP